jgi:quinolinate synthase
LQNRIQELKSARKAIVLAHHYQDPELQEVADFVGDTLELAQAAQRFQAEIIAVCGAKFMAETVKVLNPARTVLLPDLNAGCSLVDSCPVEAIRAYRKRNPKHAVVAYMHTSVEVKAESDILCTSRNAVDVVNSIPANQPILFVPDSNLGRFVQQKTGRRNMQVWQGACIVHATFAARRITALRTEHPRALIAAHPECPESVLQMADFTGSSSAIVDWCAGQAAEEFIVATDSGLRYSLEKRAPGKKFFFVANESCNCSECPYLRANTLEKLVMCLETLAPRIELSATIVERASIPLLRMLAVN